MLTTYIFDTKREIYDQLKSILLGNYPSIHVFDFLDDSSLDDPNIRKANLIFLNISLSLESNNFAFSRQSNSEVIGYGLTKQDAFKALKLQVSDFVLLPFTKDSLIESVGRVYKKIIQSKSNDQYQLVGIPTMDGVEYLKIDQIIKCEGPQKCTRVVTAERKNIVSSYNIGEFSKLLQPYNFFTPHRSFLINLNHMKRYSKDGLIYLTDQETAPLARRRKQEFLNLIPLV